MSVDKHDRLVRSFILWSYWTALFGAVVYLSFKA